MLLILAKYHLHNISEYMILRVSNCVNRQNRQNISAQFVQNSILHICADSAMIKASQGGTEKTKSPRGDIHMKYFNNITSLDELKKAYRRLAMKHHPDCGGSEEIMKQINAEHDALFETLKASHN